jgi:DNA-binding MarR family transcriptional regulator
MKETYNPRKTPGFLVRRLQQIITSIFYNQIGDVDITIAQYVALWGVEANPGIDQLRLGRTVSLDRSTIGTAVEGLERRGLLVWKTSKIDRRYKEISITKKGSKLLKDLEPSVVEVQQILLGALSSSEVSEFLRLLTKLVEAHNDLSRVPVDPLVVRRSTKRKKAPPGAPANATLK